MLFVATLVCAWPFYYAGLVITTVLTRFNAPIGRLYASDLTGASAGCLIVLGGLELIDAPSLMLWCSGIGALAGACFARVVQSRSVRRYLAFALLFFVLGIAQCPNPAWCSSDVCEGEVSKAPRPNFRAVEFLFARCCLSPAIFASSVLGWQSRSRGREDIFSRDDD